MATHLRWPGVVLFGFLLLLPAPVWSTGASLGTARGIRTVELSLDDGKTWLPFSSRSFPITDRARIRSASGGGLLDFNDGSRVNVLPFTALRVQEVGLVVKIAVIHGRLTFQLPGETRLEIWTPSARLEPVREQGMAGELFVGADGTTGLRMAQGSFRVHELADSQRTMLASLEPVFLPRRPDRVGPLFTSDGPSAAPPGAKSIFNPEGESLGYIQPHGQLVVHPGFTANLTRPFPGRLVQLAMAKVPENDRAAAMPLFDVNGGYVGYLAGPVFYAQAQVAQAVGAQAPGATGVGLGEAALGLGMATVPVVIGVFQGNKGGGGGQPPVATPLRPIR